MATFKPISYNPTSIVVPGTTSVGFLTVGTNPGTWDGNAYGLRWWNTPDLDVGWVIAHTTPAGNQPTRPGITPANGYLGFWRTKTITDSEFILLSQYVSNKHGSPQTFANAPAAKTWLNTNGYWTNWDGGLPSNGLVLDLNVWDTASYPGSGGTWYDLSGNNNNATFQGIADYDGEIQAMAFINDGSPGTNAYMSFSSPQNIPVGNSNYTISVWYSSSDPVSNGGFIGWGNYGSNNQVNALRQLNSGGNSAFVNYWWNNDLAVVTPITAGTWYNIVATFNGTTRRIYLNGNQIASDNPGSSHNVTTAANLTIGRTNTAEYFWGFISQVLVYDQGLNATQIQQIFDANKWRYGY
jgi:hypothetical protein